MATLITKNSSTASSIPTAVQLVQGELAVNVTDKRLFTENSAGAVVELGTNPSSVTTGTLTTTGKVGIGTSSPSFRLDVASDESAVPLNLRGRPSDNIAVLRFSTAANVEAAAIDVRPGSAMQFSVGSVRTERARIDASGNLLVGQTSAGAANLIGTSIENSGLNNARITVNHSNAGSSNGSSYMQFAYAGNVTGTISQSSTSTVAYNTSSDYRLKNTIAPMTGALDKVALLKPVTYKWNVDGSDGQGFIAHELAEVEPGCVTGEKDATETRTVETSPAIPAVLDEDGLETSPAAAAVTEEQVFPKYQGIDTSFLVATLAAAIQEQQAMLVSLKAIVDEQAVKIAALEAK
jgi:hypothetical protein